MFLLCFFIIAILFSYPSIYISFHLTAIESLIFFFYGIWNQYTHTLYDMVSINNTYGYSFNPFSS